MMIIKLHFVHLITLSIYVNNQKTKLEFLGAGIAQSVWRLATGWTTEG
jgi:hypothetical protein